MPEQTKTPPRSWPASFLQDFERTGTALWFFLYLVTRMDHKTQYFQAQFWRVADEIGVSVPEIRCWLEQLEREGYVLDESFNTKMNVRIAL